VEEAVSRFVSPHVVPPGSVCAIASDAQLVPAVEIH